MKTILKLFMLASVITVSGLLHAEEFSCDYSAPTTESKEIALLQQVAAYAPVPELMTKLKQVAAETTGLGNGAVWALINCGKNSHNIDFDKARTDFLSRLTSGK